LRYINVLNNNNNLRDHGHPYKLPDLWPPNSPDLNPIDYKIWVTIQQRIQSTKVQGVKDLMQHLIDTWAVSFVDDLGLSRGVVLSRAVHFCDLLRLSPLTQRFVRFRRTRLFIRHFRRMVVGEMWCRLWKKFVSG